nr:hypothetical protein [Streptomyces sp. MJM1172]
MHGKPAAIRESARHLKDFQGAFDRVGQGMRALDSGHWKGQAADAFRGKFAMHPADWLHASDACEAAAGALNRYAETLEWSQKQAQQAIDLYKAAVKAAKEAHEAYLSKVHTYNATANAGKDPGPEPQKPGEVGKADGMRDRGCVDPIALRQWPAGGPSAAGACDSRAQVSARTSGRDLPGGAPSGKRNTQLAGIRTAEQARRLRRGMINGCDRVLPENLGDGRDC